MKLLDSQKRMIPFIVEHREALLACGLGTGKTLSTILAFKELRDNLEVSDMVIVSPKRVSVLTWPSEFARWAPEIKPVSLRTPEGVEHWNKGGEGPFLINYDLLPKFTEQCLKGRRRIPAQMIVWDEIHKLRAIGGQRLKAYFPYRKLFTRHVGLSGTITPNNQLEIFNPVKALDGGARLGTAYTAFRDRYATSDYSGFKWTLDADAEERIFKRIADMTLVIRGGDWDVRMEDVEVTLPAGAMKQYRKLEKDSLVELEKREVVALSAGVLVNKLRQWSSGSVYYQDDNAARGVLHIHDAKIAALVKLHDSISREPMLVMTQYKHETERILKAIPYAREFDDTKIKEWDDRKIPMWVSDPISVSNGLNLQKGCCKICWFSLTYSGDSFPQAIGRLARPGQDRPVTVYRLIATGTVDEAIAEVLRHKGDGQDRALRILTDLRTLADAR